jgi:hypothetical protein
MRERITRTGPARRLPLAASAMLALALAAWAGSVDVAVAAEEYSVESAKASQSLMIDATHAGKRLVAVGDRGHIPSDDQGDLDPPGYPPGNCSPRCSSSMTSAAGPWP